MRDPSQATRRVGQLPDIRDEQPKPIWTQPRLRMGWIGPTIVDPATSFRPNGVTYFYRWESPWFDLRPDLRSIEAQPKLGVPIWSRSARLYVELLGIGQGFDPNNYRAVFRDYYDTTNIDPGQLPALQPGTNLGTNYSTLAATLPVDITPILFPASTDQIITSLGVFSPPGTASGGGEGYPVRYWKAVIDFTYFSYSPKDETAPPPDDVSLQAGYY
jgi:hypothetical protein